MITNMYIICKTISHVYILQLKWMGFGTDYVSAGTHVHYVYTHLMQLHRISEVEHAGFSWSLVPIRFFQEL